ncbi:prepilin-type N-terminal cleavage/methylation domain-containing protein [Candidatus Saccharibacteria bacterium]|nr:prepilin-type N-terminal cleavage/methylation domain-containing protein [Candidatus Saccharibacteria bacterium]
MTSLKKTNRGFTIVELLIVIVIIGILAALVVTTYSGIQKKARDTERKTDVNALHGQVEAYQAQNGKYPSLAQMNDSTFRGNNLKGLDAAALKDPNDQSASPTLAASPASNVYSYQATPANCDNGANGDCTTYTLTATLEAGGTYVKQSLN